MKERMPEISIIVPVYKVEEYLPACIDSILAQTFRDFELILVDDGSPDNCPALCDAAAEKDARIRVIHQKNGGLSAARNAGLDIARGEWIGFVDSDDTVAPEMYAQLLCRVQADAAQLAVCSYRFVQEDGTFLPDRSTITRDEVLTREQALERIDRGFFTTVWNRLYHRSLFETLRFPVGKLHEDEYVAHKVYWQCQRISVVAQPLYFYLQRGGGISKQKHSFRQDMDKAEGVLSRAEFAWTQKLYGVAYPACDGAANALASAWMQNGRTPEETDRLQAVTARVRTLAKELLHQPGPRAARVKLRLFLLSPKGYYDTVKLYDRLKTMRKE